MFQTGRGEVIGVPCKKYEFYYGGLVGLRTRCTGQGALGEGANDGRVHEV
jgi:hypothetical protein